MLLDEISWVVVAPGGGTGTELIRSGKSSLPYT